jgi:N-acetylglucosamine kinase-like BadF-type ATPase
VGESAGLLLGIDGGASKTAGVIIDSDGRILAQAGMAGSSIIGKPNPRSCSVLRSLTDRLCAEAGLTRSAAAHCGIGLNGVDFEDEFAEQHADISAAVGFPPEQVTLVNDGIVALWGATPAPAATMLQHGSGFTAAYRSQYGEEALFDHLDVGNVFDMRQGLLSTVARMINGQLEATPLKEQALEFLRIEDEDAYAEAVFRGTIPRELWMRTPPLIYEAWLGGDPAAEKLVLSAVDDYAVTAHAMIGKTGTGSPEVVFGGGVIAVAPDEFWQRLSARLRDYHPEITAERPKLLPEFGAAIMAGHQCEHDAQALFREVREGLPS